MSPVGVVVTSSESAQSGGVSTATGTMFLVGPASYGPETTPTLIRSLAEGVALFGPRSEAESAKLYDCLNAFFSLKGNRAYVQRPTGASTAAAKLELESAATAKTLVVTAKYKGTYGNGIKLVVETVSSESRLIIQNPEGEVIESSPLQAKASELLEWGKTHEAYVIVSEGSGYSTGKTEKVKAITATKLAGGVNPTVTKTTTLEAIEKIPKALGPGQLVVTGTTIPTEEGVHQAMGEHALKNNRFALCDMKKSEEAGKTVAELIAEKGTYTGGITGYMAFFSSAAKTAGVTLGTERTIAASPIVAGLMAQVAQTGTDNRAPAGPKWPVGPFVLSFVNDGYNETQINEFNNANINTFGEHGGQLCLFGDVTALSQEKDLIFYQYSAARERMRLIYEAEQVGQKYLFVTLDGRHQKRARFQGELQGIIKAQWEAEALYGETAAEAGAVNVGEPVNTPTSEAAGELKAEMLVRLSPVASYVVINIVSVPISEPV